MFIICNNNFLVLWSLFGFFFLDGRELLEDCVYFMGVNLRYGDFLNVGYLLVVLMMGLGILW